MLVRTRTLDPIIFSPRVRGNVLVIVRFRVYTLLTRSYLHSLSLALPCGDLC